MATNHERHVGGERLAAGRVGFVSGNELFDPTDETERHTVAG
jgi:hypothetical protein